MMGKGIKMPKKNIFDQQKAYEVPVLWSKYTTEMKRLTLQLFEG